MPWAERSPRLIRQRLCQKAGEGIEERKVGVNLFTSEMIELELDQRALVEKMANGGRVRISFVCIYYRITVLLYRRL